MIGSPVRHSLSPALHNAAFAAAGLDWRFVAFEVAPGGAADAVAAMRTLGIGGFAVTTPHKADVAAAVDEVDAASAALRSVNTVVLRDDGSTFGVSTDGDGFVDSLRAAGADPAGRRVVVLGAGGAARSIVDALGRAGAADVVDRQPQRRYGRRSPQRSRRWHGSGSLDDIAAADVLVNATSVGMGSRRVPGRPGARCTPGSWSPTSCTTRSRRRCCGRPRAAGAAAVDGLGMLVHQAARQQLLWTGVAPTPP